MYNILTFVMSGVSLCRNIKQNQNFSMIFTENYLKHNQTKQKLQDIFFLNHK